MSNPGYGQGFARSAYESEAPEQWATLIAAGAPVLGYQGNTIYDLSGYGRHGVGSGLVLSTDWVAGSAGLALRGDGSNNYVDVGTLPTINAFTFTCTAKRDNIASGYRTVAGFVANYYSLVVYDDGLMRLLSTGGSVLLGWNSVWTDESYVHHVALVQEALGAGSGISLYFDGVLVSRQTTTTSALTGLRIMEARTAFGQPFIGEMYEYRLYDSVLPAQSIAAMATDPLAMYRLRQRRAWAVTAGAGIGPAEWMAAAAGQLIVSP